MDRSGLWLLQDFHSIVFFNSGGGSHYCSQYHRKSWPLQLLSHGRKTIFSPLWVIKSIFWWVFPPWFSLLKVILKTNEMWWLFHFNEHTVTSFVSTDRRSACQCLLRPTPMISYKPIALKLHALQHCLVSVPCSPILFPLSSVFVFTF